MEYVVKVPWFGVSKGDVVDIKSLHPALMPNVEVHRGAARSSDQGGEQGVDTVDEDARLRAKIIERLDELGTSYEDEYETAALAALLSEEDMAALLEG